jgi:hypothetical protein
MIASTDSRLLHMTTDTHRFMTFFVNGALPTGLARIRLTLRPRYQSYKTDIEVLAYLLVVNPA